MGVSPMCIALRVRAHGRDAMPRHASRHFPRVHANVTVPVTRVSQGVCMGNRWWRCFAVSAAGIMLVLPQTSRAQTSYTSTQPESPPPARSRSQQPPALQAESVYAPPEPAREIDATNEGGVNFHLDVAFMSDYI